jgi:hypothetical protein
VVVPAYLIGFALLKDRARVDSSVLDETTLAQLEAPSSYENDYGLLQQRLAHLEAEVTSSDTELRRRFRDAGLV